MNEKKLSIIVPVYNVEEYLERCIDSIFCQRMAEEDMEIIMVDDGSTDNSRAIAEALAAKHHSLQLIHQENGGQSAARNTGLRHASGQYVMFVDSDDYLLPNVLDKVYGCAVQHDLDMCAYRFKTMKVDGSWYEDMVQPFDTDKIYTGEQALLKHVSISSACANLYKMEFIQQNNLFFSVGIVHEDVDFNSRAYAFAERIMFTGHLVYAYFRNENSLSRSKDLGMLRKSLLDELSVAANMKRFAETAALSGTLKAFYHRHCNSIMISLLLLYFRGRYPYAFLQQLLEDAKGRSLYPVYGKTHSWATTWMIPLLNRRETFAFYAQSTGILARLRLHGHVRWCNLNRWLHRRHLAKRFTNQTSIICNNCFGSRISQDLHLAYRSPTIGMFMYWPDYFLFVKCLGEAVKKEISFRNVSKYDGKGRDYPIGFIPMGSQDIELHFMHYPSPAVAKEKWERRCKRVNMDNCIYIYEGNEKMAKEEIEEFLRLGDCHFFHDIDLSISHTRYHAIPQMRSKHFTDGYDMAHLFYRYL